MFKRIFLIFHKLMTLYKELVTLIHQEYNLIFIMNEIDIYFMYFFRPSWIFFLQIKMSRKKDKKKKRGSLAFSITLLLEFLSPSTSSFILYLPSQPPCMCVRGEGLLFAFSLFSSHSPPLSHDGSEISVMQDRTSHLLPSLSLSYHHHLPSASSSTSACVCA